MFLFFYMYTRYRINSTQIYAYICEECNITGLAVCAQKKLGRNISGLALCVKKIRDVILRAWHSKG